MKLVLSIESVYGHPLASYEYIGEKPPLEVIVMLPGLTDDAWRPLEFRLASEGYPHDRPIPIGPLLRFKVWIDNEE